MPQLHHVGKGVCEHVDCTHYAQSKHTPVTHPSLASMGAYLPLMSEHMKDEIWMEKGKGEGVCVGEGDELCWKYDSPHARVRYAPSPHTQRGLSQRSLQSGCP